jgi:glycosyltransferase involved in cell wall biosynthesis
MNKCKVLFIVSEFYQSGTSRFTYEINLALDKSKFETTLLCLNPLNNSEIWEDYYDKKHIDLGSKIFFINEIQEKPFHPSIKQRIKRKLFKHPLPSTWYKISEFLTNYDVISLMGEYNYPYIKKYLYPSIEKKLYIHPMNSIFQKKDNYINFDKNKKFNFISAFQTEDLKYEFDEFKKFTHTYLPLSFKIPNSKPLWEPTNNLVKKIGIFTRLSSTKPLDPFIYSFQLLRNFIPNVEFHIFGSGDPEKEGISRYIRQLNLQDFIKFRGHQKDMLKTAIDEKIDLLWLHAYHSLPGGFAGFDLCSLGIPTIFWDFGGKNNIELKKIFIQTNNINEFVSHSLNLLSSSEEAKHISQIQFNYTFKNQNIDFFIQNLEDTYLKA